MKYQKVFHGVSDGWRVAKRYHFITEKGLDEGIEFPYFYYKKLLMYFPSKNNMEVAWQFVDGLIVAVVYEYIIYRSSLTIKCIVNIK